MTSSPRTSDISRRGILQTTLASTTVLSASLFGAASGTGADAHAAPPLAQRPIAGELSRQASARQAARIGELGQQSAVRSLRIGNTRITYVVDGAMELDTSGFLPAVPSSYWREHPHALTCSGRIAASVGGVLVERRRRKLLIDVGLGSNVLSPTLGISRSGALLSTLRAIRVAPEEIDTVAFTHLHTDHTGLGFVSDHDHDLRKAFPNADYLVAGAEWGPFWRREIEVGAPSWEGFMIPMSRVLRRFDDGDEVWPGVTALITPGHSPGHTTYVVSVPGKRRVLVLGDAFHVPAQVTHPEWPSGPDVDIDGVLSARATLLDELRAPRTYGFAFHFGDQTFGRTVRDHSGDFSWQPIPTRHLLPPPIRLEKPNSSGW